MRAETDGLPATTLRRIELLHGALVIAGAGATALAGSRSAVAASIFLGGGLIWANVWLFKQLFSIVVQRQPARRRLAIALLFAKLPLLWGLLWLVARSRVIAIDGAGMALGITCYPLAVVGIALARRSDTRSFGGSRGGAGSDHP